MKIEDEDLERFRVRLKRMADQYDGWHDVLELFDALLLERNEMEKRLKVYDEPATCHRGHDGPSIRLWNCPTCSEMVAERLKYFENGISNIWSDPSADNELRISARQMLDNAPSMPDMNPMRQAFLAAVDYIKSERKRSDLTAQARDILLEAEEEFNRRANEEGPKS